MFTIYCVSETRGRLSGFGCAPEPIQLPRCSFSTVCSVCTVSTQQPVRRPQQRRRQRWILDCLPRSTSFSFLSSLLPIEAPIPGGVAQTNFYYLFKYHSFGYTFFKNKGSLEVLLVLIISLLSKFELRQCLCK